MQFKNWLITEAAWQEGELKYVGSGSKCPTCGKEAVQWCRCRRADTWCENGHSWHLCPIHNILSLGESDHSKCECTCRRAEKIKEKEEISPGVRKMADDLKDYVGHVKMNGTVEPWKILPPARKI